MSGKKNQGNVANLQPVRDHEDAVARGRNGGLKSAEKRRENKRLREIADIVGERGIDVALPDNTKQHMTFKEATIFAQYKRAIMEGDTSAARFLAELLGELKQQVSVSTEGMTIVVGSQQTADAIQNIITNENHAHADNGSL